MHDVTSYDRKATFGFYPYLGLDALSPPVMNRRNACAKFKDVPLERAIANRVAPSLRGTEDF
jgi:hypothetical protein